MKPYEKQKDFLPFKEINKIIDRPTISFQATINLVIGYDPPANAAPNPNDPQAGDATTDASM